MKRYFTGFFLLLLLATGMCVAPAAFAAVCTSNVATGNWNVTGSWAGGCTAGGPIAGDTVTILNGHAITVTLAAAAATLTINNGGTLNVGAFTLTLSGATSVAAGGTLNITSAVGTKTFTGDVTVNGTWNETGAAAVSFGGNLTNNATTWTTLGGVHTFSGAGKTISGTTATVISSANVTGTCTNVNILTVSTTLAGAGTLTNGNGVTAATLNIGAAVVTPTLTANPANNTVNYTGTGQTLKVTAYNHLTLSGGAETFGAITTIAGNLTLSGTATATTAANLTIGGILTVNTGATFTVPAFTLGVTGITTLGGTLSLTSNTGAKTFTGAVTVQNAGILDLRSSSPTFSNAVTVQSGGIMQFATSAFGTKTFNGAVTIDAGGSMLASQATTVNFNADVTVNGVWNESAAVVMGFAGNLTNNATAWTADTGLHTFSGAGKTISGSTAVVIQNVSVSGTYANSATLTVASGLAVAGTLNNTGAITATAALTGVGTLVNGDGVAAATLTIGASNANLTLGTLTANANSTVTYNRSGTQTVKTPTAGYYNLVLAGTNTKTLVNTLTSIGNDLTLSGTASATTVANMTVGGNLAVNTGSAFTLAGFTLGVTGTTTVDGTLTLSSATGAKTFSSDVTVSGTWNESAAVAVNFGANLANNATSWTASTGVHTFSGTTKTISGSTTVSIPNVTVTGTYTNVNTLTVGTALAGAGALTNGNGVTAATLNIGGTSTITGLTANLANNTVNYTGAAQTVRAITYNILNLNGSGIKTITGLTTINSDMSLGGTATATTAANITIGGNLAVNGGTTFTLAGFTLGVTGTTTVGGTLALNNATGAKTFSGDVTVSGTWNESAAVTVNFGASLANNAASWTASTGVHTFSGTTKTISGSTIVSIPNVTITGTYTNVNSLTVGTALAGAGTLTNGNGVTTATLNIVGTSTIAGLTANLANNTVNYTGVAQTIMVPTASTYQALGLSGSLAKTAAGALTVNGDLTFGGTAIFAGSTFTHNFYGNWIVNSTVASSPFTFGAGSTINFNTPGTPAATSVGGTTTQIITFNSVNVNNTSGINVNDDISAAGTLTVAANATLTPAAANFVSGAGTLTGSGTVKVTRTAATADFSSQYTITSKTLTNLTVEYVGAAQTVSAITYGHLKINNASGPTLAAGTTTVGGTLTLTAGTLSVAARSLVLNGPTIAGTPANLSTTSASSLTFGGTSTLVNVPSSVTQLLNLTVNNSNGITLNSSPTINNLGTLTLTSGNILAGSNTVIIAAGGSVSRTSGHVIGNLQKNFTGAAPSRTFEIGDTAAYSPVAITFASVTSAGDLIAKATAPGEHPDVANSLIDSSKNVNRYWTLTNSGIAFTTYDATATYVPADLDAGADPTTFGVGKADACDGSVQNCTWTYPTVVGTPATTSAQASGMTGFSHFVVGRKTLTNFLVEATGGGNIGTQTVSTPFTIRITARDSTNSTVTSFTGTVQISSAGCTLSAGAGSTVNFVNGVLTSHSVTISSTATCSITATRTGGTEAGTSNSFLVQTGVTSFDACEVTTPKCSPGAVGYSDRLFTKLASSISDYSFDLVAIKSGGTLSASFAGSPTVDLLANTNVQTVGSNSCPATQTAVIPFGSKLFASGRASITIGTTTFSSVAPNYSAYRDVRVRVSCNATDCPPSGLTWCSADNFAVRPQTFAVSAPVLTNIAQTGAPSAVAGSNFALTATAVAGYDAQPTLDRTVSKVATHVGDTDFTTRLRDTGGSNTITFPAATIGTGASTATLQYHDAGNFKILSNGIVDSSFTSVDAGDCVAGSSSTTADGAGKYGCNIANQSSSALFGRFYPSYYVMSGGMVTAACTAGGFSYMGHAAMGLTYTISAMSQGNPSAGDSVKLNKYNSGYGTLATVGVLAENGATATDLSAGFSPSLAYNASNWSAGDYPVSGSTYSFARTTPIGPYESFYIGSGVTDADGATLNALDFKLGDPTCTTACTHKKLSLTSSKIRFGRLRLLNGMGAETIDLPLTLRAEYWSGSGFVTNTDDSCTTLAPSPAKKFVLYGHQGGVTAGNMASPSAGSDGHVSASGTFVNGATSLILLKPTGATSPGSVRICLDLDNGTGGDTSCQATVPANLVHLQGNWTGGSYDKDPNARSAFGLYGAQPREFIFFRETY